MPVSSPFKHKIQWKSSIVLQLVFVVLMFVLMLVSSSLYIRNMMQNYLAREQMGIYYVRELRNMELMLAGFGVVFGAALCVILIRVDKARKKADDENLKKSIKLAAMEASQEADERTQLMLDTAPMAISFWNREGIVACNEESVRLFGLSSKQEFMEMMAANKLSPEFQPCGRSSSELVAENFRQILKEGYLRTEWIHQKKDGEQFPCEITSFRIEHKDEATVLNYTRDLREYKQMMQNIQVGANLLQNALRAARDANMAKSRFLATMSHEIRTPMNVILGITESNLDNDHQLSEVKTAFEKIYNSGEILLHIINDILDLSKIEAGKFELVPVNYEVISLINNAANFHVMRYGGDKNISFKLHASENLPLELYGDELRIKQIINNLLSNAFKYTDVGGVSLSFSAENTADGMTTLVIRVSDTGQGMTQEHIKKMFEEYSRFNLEANRNTAGTGLGMAITHNLVQLMKGDISVESTLGKGSTFTVRIPQEIVGQGVLGKEIVEKISDFNLIETANKKKKIIREPMPYGKVLLVDDMQSNLDVAMLILQPYKLQIDTAESGFAAFEKIKSGNEYHIIFMDHMMPGLNGMETTKLLREIGYKKPIFALTADVFSGQQDVFLSSGFDGYLAKPIDQRQLNDTLNEFIRDKEKDQHGEIALPESTVAEIKKQDTEKQLKETPVINIPGINTEKGLSFYDDEPGDFIKALRYFIPNALFVLSKLSDVSDKTLNDYAVNIHGLKGSSAWIGAESLTEAALKLEQLAKSGDLAGVLTENASFTKEAEKLISDIQAWLDKFDGH